MNAQMNDSKHKYNALLRKLKSVMQFLIKSFISQNQKD